MHITGYETYTVVVPEVFLIMEAKVSRVFQTCGLQRSFQGSFFVTRVIIEVDGPYPNLCVDRIIRKNRLTVLD